MMPHSTKPKITQADITSGYVTRRFIKHVSRPTVVEVSAAQYNIFAGNGYYQRLSFQWVIGGTDIDIPTVGGQVILGAKSQNEILTAYYDKQMSGLSRILRNPLEFFSGKYIKLA